MSLEISEQRDYIKLIKTSKSYSWEIKVHQKKREDLTSWIERINVIDIALKDRFSVVRQ